MTTRSIQIRLRFAWLILLTALSLSAMAQSIEISVSYPRGRDFFEVGERFYINVSANDVSGALEVPKEVPGCKVLYFQQTGSSSRMSNINGKVTHSSSTLYTLTLSAKSEGTYNYSFKSRGMTSNSVKINIKPKGTVPTSPTPGSSSSAQRGAQPTQSSDKPEFIGEGDQKLFMVANVSKTNAYEQEALVYTIKLYSSYPGIRFLGATETPKFEGFVIEQSDATDRELRTEEYRGKIYETAVVARYIIFPQSPGKKKIIGNTYTVSVDKRMYYNDAFWGAISYGVPLTLNIKPNDLTIDVKALPHPQPLGFTGAVGQFNITSDLPSANMKTNQASIITYTISGSGNIRYVNAPDLKSVYPSQIDVYTPTVTADVVVGRDDVSGHMTYEYSLMPTMPGNFALPSIDFTYFDPRTAEYKTLHTKGYDVTVAQGEASEKSQTREKRVFNPALTPISKLSRTGEPMVSTFAYWMWYIIPLLLLIAAGAAYQYQQRLSADPEALKARRAHRLAAKWLKQARLAAERQNTEDFYNHLLAALWGYLGDKLKMKASLLTRGNVEEILSRKGVPEEIIHSVISIIDKAEFVKYTSINSNENMQELLDDSERLIAKVEDTYDKKRTSHGEALSRSITNLETLSRDDVKAIRKEISQNKTIHDHYQS